MRFAAAVVLLIAGSISTAEAKRGSGRRKTVEVPVGVAFGPALYWITGPVADDQLFHFGATIDVYAVIDQKTIRENQDRIPKSFRKMAMKLDEVRIRPLIFIPRSLIISPKIENTGIYGISFRPLGFGISLSSKPIRLNVSIGLIATYAFMHSDVLPEPTHFLRPGLDPTLDIEIPFSDSFLISLGWASQFYLPQVIGEFGIGDIDKSIWHIGQPYLRFHFRFPYQHSF